MATNDEQIVQLLRGVDTDALTLEELRALNDKVQALAAGKQPAGRAAANRGGILEDMLDRFLVEADDIRRTLLRTEIQLGLSASDLAPVVAVLDQVERLLQEVVALGSAPREVVFKRDPKGRLTGATVQPA